MPLLRIYWYDGTSTGPSAQHIDLAFRASVKLRLGFVNTVGEQKGVDSLIVTDMITLARNGAMADGLLLSGDEDLRVGVQQAQEFGVKVHLLGIKPCRGSQSQFLLQEADTTHEWTETDVAKFLSIKPQGPQLRPPGSGAAARPSATIGTASPTIMALAAEVAAEVPEKDAAVALLDYDSTGQIVPQLDRPLLGRAQTHFGLLNADQKKQLRVAFIAALRTRGVGGSAQNK